jgi:hypothetical protein
MRAGTNATASRAAVISTAMRGGAIATAVVASFGVVAFFHHESPPTMGHVAAAVAIGVPAAIMAVAAITLPVSRRNGARLLLLQLITTGAILGVLVSQRSNPPVRAWFGMLLLLGLPIAATALFIRALPRLGQGVPTVTANAGQSVATVDRSDG